MIVMLQRKFTSVLERYLTEGTDKILLVNGARQIGKSYLIRYVGQKLYRHYVEINLQDDKNNQSVFAHVRSKEDMYLQIGAIANTSLGDKSDTLILPLLLTFGIPGVSHSVMRLRSSFSHTTTSLLSMSIHILALIKPVLSYICNFRP